MQSKNFCMTIYPKEMTYTDGLADTCDIYMGLGFIDILFTQAPFQYILAGNEVCPTTGKKYYQVYVQTKTKKTCTFVGGVFEKAGCKHPFIQIAKAGYDENYNYCTKDGDFKEVGTAVTRAGQVPLRFLNGDMGWFEPLARD